MTAVHNKLLKLPAFVVVQVLQEMRCQDSTTKFLKETLSHYTDYSELEELSNLLYFQTNQHKPIVSAHRPLTSCFQFQCCENDSKRFRHKWSPHEYTASILDERKTYLGERLIM